MRLSEIVSSLELSTYPEIALVIFLAVFAAVVVRTYARSNREQMRCWGTLPLEGGTESGRADESGIGGRP